MTIPRRPEDGPYHIRLKCRPNTPDEQVAAFMANNKMVRCKAYNCLLTVVECKARKRKALLAKRITYHGNRLNSMATGEFVRLRQCLKCRRTP